MKSYILPAVLILGLSSCATIYVPFMPDKVHSPGLGGQNEGKLDVSSSSYNMFSADVSYAPIDHLGIIASYGALKYRPDKESGQNGQAIDRTSTRFGGNRFDLGVGYFTAFNTKGRFEVYAGYGIGNLYCRQVREEFNPYSIVYNNIDANLARYFIQLAAGKQGDVFSIMAGVRGLYQPYSNMKITTSSLSQPTVLVDGPYHIQPYCDFRIGYKYIKFTTQIGWGLSTSSFEVKNGQEINQPGELIPSPYVSIGLVFHFSPEYFGSQSNPK